MREKRQVDGKQRGWPVLAAEAELVSHGRSRKMVCRGALALCSQYPVTTTQARERWSPTPWTSSTCFFKEKIKSESSQRIETAWSNQSAF